MAVRENERSAQHIHCPRQLRIAIRGNLSCAAVLGIPPRFEEAGSFSEGYASVLIDGKYGYIDAKGRMAIGPQFYAAEAFLFCRSDKYPVEYDRCGRVSMKSVDTQDVHLSSLALIVAERRNRHT